MRSYLRLARLIRLGGNLAKGGISEAGIRIYEARRVGEVEKLTTELNFEALANREVLED